MKPFFMSSSPSLKDDDDDASQQLKLSTNYGNVIFVGELLVATFSFSGIPLSVAFHFGRLELPKLSNAQHYNFGPLH